MMPKKMFKVLSAIEMALNNGIIDIEIKKDDALGIIDIVFNYNDANDIEFLKNSMFNDAYKYVKHQKANIIF